MEQEQIVSFIREKSFILLLILVLFLGGFGWFFYRLMEKKGLELRKEVRVESSSTSLRNQGIQKEKKIENAEKLNMQKVKSMKFEDKIGQILLTSIDGYDLSFDEFNLLKEGSVSGFLLFSKNIKDEKQLINLTLEINKIATVSASGIGSIIAVDQEGGNVSRINWIDKTSQIEIKTEKEAYQVGLERGRQLKDLGIRMNLSPVVECGNPAISIQEEVNKNKNEFDNFISKQNRGFEKNCKELSWAMIDGYGKAGILGVGKHFPDGLVFTDKDPHLVLPRIDLSREEVDLENYKYLIDRGMESLMVTHLVYPEIANVPSSKSQVFIREILRNDLGFDGLVVVDDLSMGALSQENLGEFVVDSIKSGGDLFIVSNRKDYEEVYKYLVGVKDGEFEERLDESVERILRVKEKYGSKIF